MPPALKALLAQLLGCTAAFAAARSGVLPAGLWPLVAVQAAAATGAAVALKSAHWWRWIHLGFLPLVVGALQLGIPPGWYLAAFLVFALIYWSSFRTQVPLFLSNRLTAETVAGLLPAERPAKLLDLGSGTGSLLRPLARMRPDCEEITRASHKARAGWLTRLRWTLSWFVVTVADYTVSRRLNFGLAETDPDLED